jgi:hypothetical protein
VTLPEAELSFYFAAPAQLEPARRPVFTERVTRLLGAHPNPGPGDVGRARLVSCGALVDSVWTHGGWYMS